MTHLLDEPHNGKVHVTATFPDAHFKTVLRLPRERRGRVRRVRPVYARAADDISPALVLGCAVVIVCAVASITFAAFVLGQKLFEAVRHLQIGG